MIKITQTTFTGKEVHSFKTLESTNDFSKSLINSNSVPNGTIIHSEYQTAGRGQRTKQWIGNPGENIYISFIYHFNSLKADHLFSIHKLSSLAILQTLNAAIDLKFRIKWPNDIYHKDNKVAGILIENTLSDGHLKSSIIGIGININQTDYPPELSAASLKSITSRTYDIYNTIDSLATQMEKNYISITEDYKSLDTDYHLNLYKLNERQKFKLNGIPKEAILRGIDKWGRLKLESENQLRAYDHHEVQWLID